MADIIKMARQGQQDEGLQDEADRQKSLLDWGDKVLDRVRL